MVDSNHHHNSSTTLQHQETPVEDVDDRHLHKEGEEDDTFVGIILMQRELNTSPSSHPLPQNQWIESARLDSIQWIFYSRALFRFQCQTAYLSVAYFDMFLSRRMIDSDNYWAVRLLSVACLILAAKMEECEVPQLTDFSVPDYDFDNEVIQRMELLVLNTLKWKMSLVTPFDYLRIFLSKLCEQNASTNLVLSRATDFVFALIKDISSMTYRPSVIAAAATLLAMDQKLTRQCVELKISALFSENLQTEDVFSCYTRMQGLENERFKLPESILFPNLSSDVFRGFSVTSSTSRKRLRYDDYDQNCGK